MERSPFLDIALQVDSKIDGLKTQSQNVINSYKSNKVENAYKFALELENNFEKCTLLSRQLPCYTGKKNAKHEVLSEIKDVVKVDLRFTKEGWFYMKIPALLPLKHKGRTEYIKGFLYPALHEFFAEIEPIRFDKCIIIYRHIYSKNRPERRYRDHDNFEVNFVTDAVALHVMVDDSPRHCNHYYCSAIGDEESTEVFVIPQVDHIKWLLEYDE